MLVFFTASAFSRELLFNSWKQTQVRPPSPLPARPSPHLPSLLVKSPRFQVGVPVDRLPGIGLPFEGPHQHPLHLPHGRPPRAREEGRPAAREQAQRQAQCDAPEYAPEEGLVRGQFAGGGGDGAQRVLRAFEHGTADSVEELGIWAWAVSYDNAGGSHIGG